MMETARQSQDAHYASRGRAATQNDLSCVWLFSGDCSSRELILSELGRIGDPEAIRHVAEHICELKPPPEEAVALIRQWQSGKTAKRDATAVADR